MFDYNDKVAKADKFNRFDFEQMILNCWNITKDIDDAYGHFYEQQYINNDDLANVLLGLKALYDIKFQNLFTMFENSVAKESVLKEELSYLQEENARLKSTLENSTPKIVSTTGDH